MFSSIAEKVRQNEPLSPAVAALLTAAVPVIRLGMWIRLHRPRTRVDAAVISFGNITAGGTGKTPAVIERARAELAAGKKVAVLTRGYGSRHRAPVVVTGRERSTADIADRIGDEPALIARKVPGVLIVKDPDRVAAARIAIEEFGCDVLILDDGFQYVQLERDENVVLIDATNPFGNGRVIPRGILREPLAALSRATHVVLTHCDQAEELHALVDQLKKLCSNVPVRKTCHAPESLWRVADGVEVPLDVIRDKEVRAVCGIGNPEAFFLTLESLGARLVERRAYPDHCAYTPDMIPSSGLVVTTEKDAVRVTDTPPNLHALAVELRDLD